MESAKFKYVSTNFNFEVVELSDGSSYLVDMGTPVIAWLTLIMGCFIPRRCYAISDEDKIKILGQERKRNYNTGLIAGIAIIISAFIRNGENALLFHFPLFFRIMLIMISLIAAFGLRLFFVHRAEEMISSRGVSLNDKRQFTIRFSVKGIKPLLKQALMAIIVWSCLLFFFFFIL